MARDNGGVIGVLNTPTSTTASGVWALQDQYEAKRNGTWPLTPFVSPNSARFNSGSSDYLNRTPSSTGNPQKFTISTWVKRSSLGSYQHIFACGTGSSRNWFGFTPSDTIELAQYSGGYTFDVITTQVFRDVSAWYHIVMAFDTTQSTSTDRIKLYINGTQVTSFGTTSYPSQNLNTYANTNGYFNNISKDFDSSNYVSGYLSEFYLIDGQQLTPSSFGASNASGVWYPIPYTGSYGTNGFNLKFTNASSLGTDSSPNGNNFTVNNLTSVDQSTDSTLNNFATLNPLVATGGTYTEGNLQYQTATTDGNWSWSSITPSSGGNWYCEAKMISSSNGTYQVGITAATNGTPRILYVSNGAVYLDGSNVATYATYTTNDIIGMAYNSSTKSLTFYKNGISQGSQTASSTNDYYFGSTGQSGGATHTISFNFGSPAYSANSYADGNGYGNFSYAVPSGYYALCTANLNTYG